MDKVLVVTTLISLLTFFLVIELVRRNRLKEKYSLLWLFASVALLFFSVYREALHRMAAFVGVQYPPSLIFLMAIFFILIINIHFSTVISRLTDRNRDLAQELALLKQSLERNIPGPQKDRTLQK